MGQVKVGKIRCGCRYANNNPFVPLVKNTSPPQEKLTGMNATAPHYLLYSESRPAESEAPETGDRWRFSLRTIEGDSTLEAEDSEPDARGDRLELLAVVRGLEALDQPSRVTLVTSSRYVRLGLAYGLEDWKSNGWRWQRYGRLVPVKHRDLWQRVDRALMYHTLECRTWRIDRPHTTSAAPQSSNQTGPKIRGRLHRAMDHCRSRWGVATVS